MPDETSLKYAIGLSPKKAIEYFKSKGYTFSWNWYDTWQEAHAKAFTVAKAMRMDILQDIRDMLQKALKEGITFKEFKKELEPRLKAKGWWGRVMVADETGATQVQLGSPYRLKTIYQTNMQTAYMAGRYKMFMENVDSRPYWQYVAVMDRRTRPAHAALNGKVFRYDDPFWKTHYPPLGFNCRCRVEALSEQDIEREGLPKPPKPEDTERRITWKDVLINKHTGELRQVAVYHDPTTGMKIATDPGWSYNPGLVSWFPDVWRWDQDLRKLYFKNHPYFLHIENEKIRDFLQAEAESCSLEARIIIEKFKYSVKFKETSGTPHYNMITKEIYLNPDYKGHGSFVHGLMHMIDDLFKLSEDSEFVRHFWDDVRRLSENYGIPELREGGKYYNHPTVSGFFDSLTKGKLKGNYSHAPEYWTARPDAVRLKEALAKLFSAWATDKEAYNFIKQHCYFLALRFEKLIYRLLKV